jgi:hypothetical protein
VSSRLVPQGDRGTPRASAAVRQSAKAKAKPNVITVRLMFVAMLPLLPWFEWLAANIRKATPRVVERWVFVPVPVPGPH